MAGQRKAIEFVYPVKTAAVSVTGKKCFLNCAHCGGHYLRPMISLTEAKEMAFAGKATSFLISGGCNSLGKVPLWQHRDFLKKLAAWGSLNLHTGLVNQAEAEALGKLARVISFDMVGDQETIKEVYGLRLTPADYLQVYRFLRKTAPRVVPHICIGLRGGTISGELNTLALLKKEGATALCFLIFRPTPGTAYAKCPPPPLSEVTELIKKARSLFPHTPLYLGCMRPGGAYRQALDPLAVEAGLDKIVVPAPSAWEKATGLGLLIKTSKECCAL